MTNVKKNLLIAALERALWDGKQQAGIATLSSVEATIADLRTAYDTDPASVTDEALSDIVQKISRLTFPVENPWRLYMALQGQDGEPLSNPLKVYWANILNKPALAPLSHAHVKSEISDFPATMPPDAHSHVKSEISDFPATMPPDAHTHVKSEISDFPATMPPDAHTHVKSEISDFPATMPPDAHSHVKSEISDFPATMPPDAHTHTKAQITDFPHTHSEYAQYSHSHSFYSITDKPYDYPPSSHYHVSRSAYIGNGTVNRLIYISGYSAGIGQMIVKRQQGTSSAIYFSYSTDNSVVYHGGALAANAYTNDPSGILLASGVNAIWNVNGVSYEITYFK